MDNFVESSVARQDRSSAPFLFDVHTHTQFAAYAEDKDAVIRRALDAGVWMVNVGTQRDTSEASVETAHQYMEGVYASVGLHPVHTERSYHDAQELDISDKQQATGDKGFTSRGEEFDFEYYKKLAQDPKVVAIGECGLDYYRSTNQESRIKQERAFRAQIELAQEVKKPLMIHCRNAFADLITALNAKRSTLNAHSGMIHCRNAFDDLIKILDAYFLIHDFRPSGIIHFFAGTVDDARALLDLGFSFSFGGVITFARDYDEVVRYIPIERIVLETDAPYITPVPHRGRRNEPAYIVETARKLAELKTLSYETTVQTTTENARKIFDI